MKSWQAHASLCRSRILGQISQVTNSIALSLQHFHLSSVHSDSSYSPSNMSLGTRSIRHQKASGEVQNLLSGNLLNDALRQRRPPINQSSNPRQSQQAPNNPIAFNNRSAASGFQRLPAARPPPGQRPLMRKTTPVLTSEAGTRESGIFRGAFQRNAVGRSPLPGGGINRGGILNRGRGKGTQRKRNTGRGVQRGEDGPTEFTAEEEVYLKEKARRDAPSPIAYHPDMTAEDLSKLGPAVFLGQWGMSEIVEEKLARLAPAGLLDQGARYLELIKEMLSGEFVRFKNDEELKNIITLAESRAKRYAEMRSEEKGEVVKSKPVEFETLDEDTKTRLVTNWFKGEYVLQNPSSEIAVLQHLRVATGLNASYLPKDQDSIAEKVRGLLPAQPSSPASRRVAR